MNPVQVWSRVALFEQPFDGAPIHPASVRINSRLADEAEVSAIASQAETDVGWE